MSILTIATLTLIVVVVLGLVIVLGEHIGPVETHHISTRELPNVAADLHRRTGTSDMGPLRR